MVEKKKRKAVSGTGNHEDLKMDLNALEPERKISETPSLPNDIIPSLRDIVEYESDSRALQGQRSGLHDLTTLY